MPGGFYFSIHCPTDSTVFYQKSLQFSENNSYLKNLEKLIFDFSFFSNSFREINVIYVNHKQTLVPREFYEKKLTNELLSFNHHNIDNKVIVDTIEKLDCKLIWGMDNEVHNFLSRMLLNPSFSSHLTVLVSLFYELHDISISALYINFNDDGMIDAVAFSQDKLQLAKTFQTTSPLEGCYFIQKTWEILKFDAYSDKIYFSGDTEKNRSTIETIKKLFPHSKELSIEIASELKINQSETPTEILYQLCEL